MGMGAGGEVIEHQIGAVNSDAARAISDLHNSALIH
jgi:hypothetical protein